MCVYMQIVCIKLIKHDVMVKAFILQKISISNKCCINVSHK